VFLPTQTLYESGGIFVNQEGRAQYSAPAFAGGAPVLETGGGDHPPRIYGAGLPGADPQPAGRIMAQLAGDAIASAMRTRQDYFTGAIPELAKLAEVEAFPEEGLRIAARSLSENRFKAFLPPPAAAEMDEFEILLTERTFGTEELASYSACLETLEDEPFAGLHRTDAEPLGIRDGDRIAIRTANARVEVAASVFDNMAPGVLVLPRLQRLPWQALGKRVHRRDLLKV
jgi:NADH-quinone oxidoreductase subunit G